MGGAGHALVTAALGAVAVFVYANSLDGEFVFDDHGAITHNDDVTDPAAPARLQAIWDHDYWGTPLRDAASHKSWRPLTTFTFRVNAMLQTQPKQQQQQQQQQKLDPTPFHRTNVALHGLTTMLFHRLCARHAFAGARGGAAVPSALAALLFAVHPVHAEAVAGLAGRADVLAGLFFLLSLLAHAAHAAPGSAAAAAAAGEPAGAASAVGAALRGAVWAALAMLSKESGITALGVSAAVDLLLLIRDRRTEGAAAGAGAPDAEVAARAAKAKAERAASWWRLLTALAGAGTLLACRLERLGGGLPHFEPSDAPAAAAPPLPRRLTSLYLWYRHFALLFFPHPGWHPLCCDWSGGSIPLVESVADPRNRPGAAMLVLLALLALTVLRTAVRGDGGATRDGEDGGGAAAATTPAPLGALPWGLGLLVIPFVPASGAFFTVGFVLAERVLYLPSMGACVLAVWALGALPCGVGRALRVPAALALAAGAASVTVARNSEWATQERLFGSALRVAPANAKLWEALATDQAARGNTTEAVGSYARSLALSDGGSGSDGGGGGGGGGGGASLSQFTWQASSHRRYAEVLRTAGDDGAALEQLRRALLLWPDHPQTLYDMGLIRSSSSAMTPTAKTNGDDQNERKEGAALRNGTAAVEHFDAAARAFSAVLPEDVAPPPGGRLLSATAARERYGAVVTAHPAYAASLKALCAAELDLDGAREEHKRTRGAVATAAAAAASSSTAAADAADYHAARAVSFCRMAINMDPGDWPSTANLATVLERTKDAAGAVDVLKLFMQPGRGSANRAIMREFRVRLGLLYLNMGENDSAGHWLDKAVERTPSDEHAQIALAIIRMRQGDLKAAKRHADVAKGLMPDAPMVALNYPHIMKAVARFGLVGEGRGLAQDFTAGTNPAAAKAAAPAAPAGGEDAAVVGQKDEL